MLRFERAVVLADLPVRTGLRLTPERREAVLFLLGRLEDDPGFTMVRELAYVLATIQWETAGTMQPVAERRLRRARAPRARETQDRYWRSGFYGRGYVQITWRENYERAERRLRGAVVRASGGKITIGPGTLTGAPELLLERDVAYLVCSRGMREGWFTGRRLDEFIREDGAPDYEGARRVVNGLDHAEEIADLACRWELLLRAARSGGAAAPEAGGVRA